MLLGWGRRSVTLLYSMGKVVGFVCGSGRERCGGSRESMGGVDLEYSTGSN